MEFTLFIIGVAAFVLIIIGVNLWTKRRQARRRDSLRRDNDTGTYYWIGMDGSPQQSKTDPSKKGGQWDKDDAGGGGDGGGGWGGGDGGGGGGDGGGGGGGG